MLRPCLGSDIPCPDSALTPRTRCPVCQSRVESLRPSRRVRGRYDAKWEKIRAVALKQHPWCESCRTQGSETNPLTGDHRVPLSRGGRNVLTNVAVLCRSCNSAKGERVAVGIGASHL